MSSQPVKVIVLISNYFTSPSFDELLHAMPTVQRIDVVSVESGKVRTWNKAEKEYYTIPLHKDNIKSIRATDYSTVIIHSDILNYGLQTISPEIKSFVDFFMVRKKPIVAVYQGPWIVVASSSLELHPTLANQASKLLRATA